MEQHSTILETIRMGNSLKVTAVDTATGTEASIICDIRTPQKQREQLAIRKLAYVLKKNGN